VPAIVGFGAAAEAVDVEHEAARNRTQTERALAGALAVDGVRPYGAAGDERLPHLVCMGVDGVEAEAVLLGLDQAGVAAHSGSACSSESLEPSPVLQAMGVDADRSLRVSVGWSTTDADIDAFVTAFPGVVERLRALR
jgi:cysteine desulfurase